MMDNDPHKIETKTNEGHILLRMENGLQNSYVAFVFICCFGFVCICWFGQRNLSSSEIHIPKVGFSLQLDLLAGWTCSWTCWQVGLAVGLAGR